MLFIIKIAMMIIIVIMIIEFIINYLLAKTSVL